MFMTEANHLKTVFLILLAKECQLHKDYLQTNKLKLKNADTLSRVNFEIFLKANNSQSVKDFKIKIFLL